MNIHVFPFLAVRIKAAVNILVEVLKWTYAFFFSWVNSRNGIVGSYVGLRNITNIPSKC